jgi:DNA polymerase alpha subunit B
VFVAPAYSLQSAIDATFIGVDLCQTFTLTPIDLYFKWESIVISQNEMGKRYIDNATASAIKAVIQSELTKVTKSLKVEPGLRRPRGAPPMGMLGLGSRMNMKQSGVGLVDTAATPRSKFPTAQGVGKAVTSKVAFECLDIEEVSQDKRNCKHHIVWGRRPISH